MVDSCRDRQETWGETEGGMTCNNVPGWDWSEDTVGIGVCVREKEFCILLIINY